MTPKHSKEAQNLLQGRMNCKEWVSVLYPYQADRGRLEVPGCSWGSGRVPSCRNLHGREGRATHWGQGDPASNRSTAPSVMERGRASVKARRQELVQPGNERVGKFCLPSSHQGLCSPGQALPPQLPWSSHCSLPKAFRTDSCHPAREGTNPAALEPDGAGIKF